MKMLFWKEWREARGIILLGLLAVLLGKALVVNLKLPDELGLTANELTVPLYLFICGLVGGGLVARETNRGTLSFLLSLPSSRVRLMVAKVLIGALLPLISPPLIFKGFFGGIKIPLIILPLGLFYLASALFFSSSLDKTITAVIAGFAFASLFFVIFEDFIPYNLMGYTLAEKLRWPGIIISLSAVLFLVSFLIFARQEVK